MRKETPEPWLKLMEASGYTSLRGLAEAAGVSHPVINRMVQGTGKPKDESISAVAEALRVRPSVIYGLVMMSAPSESAPWNPPAEAARLTTSQRDALAQLIRTMVNPEPAVHRFAKPVDHGQRSYELAANRGANQGRALHDAASQRGEESQDTHEDH